MRGPPSGYRLGLAAGEHGGKIGRVVEEARHLRGNGLMPMGQYPDVSHILGFAVAGSLTA